MSSTKPGVTNGGDLLEVDQPNLTVAEARAIASETYGLDVEAKALAGERDRNFLLSIDRSPRCVLKIYNQTETAGSRDFQQSALIHLQRHGLQSVPQLILTRDGATGFSLTRKGETYHGTLISFLHGIPQNLAPGTSALRQDIGRSCALLDRALADFNHQAAHRDLLWDVMQISSLWPMVDLVADERRRSWIGRFISRFCDEVIPVLSFCRSQVIHNDINTSNLLVAQDRVSGIIDFGDMVHAPLINEIGVAAGYVAKPTDDLFEVISDLVRGFELVTPLLERETRLLYDVVVARMVVRVLIYLWRSSLFPQNREYILRNSETAWSILDGIMCLAPGEGQSRVMDEWRIT